MEAYVLCLLLTTLVSGCLAYDCYKCVYDGTEQTGAQVYSAVSFANKANDPLCKGGGGILSNLDTCGILSPNCLTISYKYPDGNVYVSRGCTSLISCFNTTKGVTISGKSHQAKYMCCKHSRCNAANAMTMTSWLLGGLLLVSAVSRFWI